MKIRLCYAKTETGRYLSHLDLARAMERSLRRAKVPLAFSEGFNPHPKLSFASALAVGITGCREYLDVELISRINIKTLSEALQKSFPPALAFVAAEEIGEHSRSLSAVVNLAVYRVKGAVRAEDEEKLLRGIEKVLAAAELWRKPKEKPGKKPGPAKEVRGLIRRITVIGAAPGAAAEAAAVPAPAPAPVPEPVSAPAPEAALAPAPLPGPVKIWELEMALGLGPDGQLRPQELWEMIAEAGGFEASLPLEVCRRALLIEQDGKSFAPMEGVRD
jgi:radical SAM-linked protein